MVEHLDGRKKIKIFFLTNSIIHNYEVLVTFNANKYDEVICYINTFSKII